MESTINKLVVNKNEDAAGDDQVSSIPPATVKEISNSKKTGINPSSNKTNEIGKKKISFKPQVFYKKPNAPLKTAKKPILIQPVSINYASSKKRYKKPDLKSPVSTNTNNNSKNDNLKSNIPLETLNDKFDKKQILHPIEEEIDVMTASREKDTVLIQALATDSDLKNDSSLFYRFYSYQKIAEVPLELQIEKLDKLKIPKLTGKTVKVSMHVFNEKPICDVFSDYNLSSGFAACDGWVDISEFHYIPEGMNIELFKLKDFTEHKRIDKRILGEEFLKRATILYFKYYYYNYSDDSYSTDSYEVYFKSSTNNLTYRYNVYSRNDKSRKLTCYFDGKQKWLTEYLFLLKIIQKNKIGFQNKEEETKMYFENDEDKDIAEVFIKLSSSANIIKSKVFQFINNNVCWPWQSTVPLKK